MNLSIKKLTSLFFLAFGIFYLAFGYSLEQRRMIGDERGWDPGSKAMPIGIGTLIIGLSIFVMLKEIRSGTESEKPIDSGSKQLIALTIILSGIYIYAFRYVGFILSTHLLLFTLIYFYYSKRIDRQLVPHFLWGLGAGSGFILLFYSTGTYAYRFLFSIGKQAGVEILTNRLLVTGLTFLLLAGVFIISLLVGARVTKTRPRRNMVFSFLIAAGITELLYLIFKQLFWVSFPKGLLFW